jgi:hypothetical protein
VKVSSWNTSLKTCWLPSSRKISHRYKSKTIPLNLPVSLKTRFV